MSDNGTSPPFATTEDYWDFFNESYSPCNSMDLKKFGTVFLPTLYTLVFIVGFVGNGMVVCVLVKHRSQTNMTDICLLNLALSDLLFLLTLPLYAHFSAVGRWTFGDLMCRLVSACHLTGFFSSIFFMVVMTLDRYMVIMHTHGVARHRTKRAGVVLSSLVWLLSLCVSLPAFVFTEVTEDLCLYIPSDNSVWEYYPIFATNILGLVIPLLVMVVCYSSMIPTLLNMRSAKRHRVVKLIVSIVVAFFLFWVPYNVSIVLHLLQSKGMLSNECNFQTSVQLAVTLTETFAYTHCCLNPIIYAFVGQKFKKRASQLLGTWVPGICLPPARGLWDSSFWKGSVTSRSSDVTSSFVM